jgi:hypothetical protein
MYLIIIIVLLFVIHFILLFRLLIFLIFRFSVIFVIDLIHKVLIDHIFMLSCLCKGFFKLINERFRLSKLTFLLIILLHLPNHYHFIFRI